MSDLTEYWDDVDTDSVEAQTGRPDPIPSGDYTLQMVSSEIVMTKAGTGVMLNCQFKVVEGEYEGRVIFNRFNVRNANAQAQSIGIGQFKGLCMAAGVPFETAKVDTSALYYQPFVAKIGLSKTTDQYPDPNNEIKGYKAPVEATKAPAAKTTPAAKSAPAKASGSLPWKTKAA